MGWSAQCPIKRDLGNFSHVSLNGISGNSLSAIFLGVARLSFLDRGEEYYITMPYAHCKGRQQSYGPWAFFYGCSFLACAFSGVCNSLTNYSAFLVVGDCMMYKCLIFY